MPFRRLVARTTRTKRASRASPWEGLQPIDIEEEIY